MNKLNKPRSLKGDDLEKIYLRGMQIYGKRPGEFMGITAGFGAEGDREGWERFLETADAIFAEYGDIPFVHWHHYERVHIEMYVHRYGDPAGVAARVLRNRCIIVVQRSRTKKSKLKAPEAGRRNGVAKKRGFSLSPSLTEQLRPFVEGRGADEPLFLTPGRLTKSGKRLGHVDARTTMGHTHLVTADDVRIAGELGALFDKEFLAQDLPKFPPNAEKASALLTEVI